MVDPFMKIYFSYFIYNCNDYIRHFEKKTIQNHETSTYQYLVSLNNRGTPLPNCVMIGKRVPQKLREKLKTYTV